jgi:hypothetical protein
MPLSKIVGRKRNWFKDVLILAHSLVYLTLPQAARAAAADKTVSKAIVLNGDRNPCVLARYRQAVVKVGT